MNFQDYILAVEMVLLVMIWLDGRVMKQTSVESVEIHRQSLEAQKAYLDLRRRWYEQRNRKKEAVKENEKAIVGPSTSDSTNS